MQGAAAPKYWAFLSYSHANEAIASRLHRELERYALPRRVRKAYALPARLTPIFRDVEELEAASGLNTRLQDALDESRWLIVLCSPASAKSKYVNAEIEYFLGKHGANRILCALLDGEPPECFPPALRALKDEPLAADLRAGRDHTLAQLKLVAALAGVGFTELRNREAQRRKRQRLVAAAALAAGAIGGALYWDLYYREHSDYYAGSVRRNGIWEGVDQVSAAAAERRNASYRFLRHGRLSPPERVDYVAGSGACAGDGVENILGERLSFDLLVPANRFCTVTFEYARDGQLERETLLNGFGKPKETLAYTAADLAQFTQEGFAASSEASGVNYVQFQRDASGHDASVRFLYARGVPRANRAHQYGFAMTRDAAGRMLTRETLNDQGQGAGEIMRYAYTAMGDVQELRLEDPAGQLRPGVEGFAVDRFERDEAGNAVSERYLSIEGQPTLILAGRVGHYAQRNFIYDPHGNLVQACYLDADGKPGVSSETTAECERRKYDGRGRLTWLAAFDHAGKPSTANLGFFATELSYDAQGNVAESRNVDEHGTLVEEISGIALQRFAHDPRGNLISEFFYGADGKPARTRYGAEIRHTVDLRDRYMEFSFFDVDGKPFLRPDTGMASAKFKRDERGNLVEIVSLDADLKPIVSKRFGAAYRVNAFDDQGNQLESRMLDPQRRLMRDKDGVAIYRRQYDPLGRCIEETYFDAMQRPARHLQGYYGYRAEFDHRGREQQRTYLDARGGPMRVARLGAAGVRYDHDALGRVMRETYLGENGAALAGGAVQRMDYVRDKYGEELERRYYDHGGQLAIAPGSGCAVETHLFNSVGRLIQEQCLGADQKPRNRRDEGWARKLTSWDHGRMEAEQYLDAAGKTVKPRNP